MGSVTGELASFSTAHGAELRVVLAHLSAVEGTLSLILSSGELLVVSNLSSDGLSQQSAHVELVGEIDGGIAAAQWSADEEVLVLVTGTSSDSTESKVVILTADYQVLFESPLQTRDWGEGAHHCLRSLGGHRAEPRWEQMHLSTLDGATSRRSFMDQLARLQHLQRAILQLCNSAARTTMVLRGSRGELMAPTLPSLRSSRSLSTTAAQRPAA